MSTSIAKEDLVDIDQPAGIDISGNPENQSYSEMEYTRNRIVKHNGHEARINCSVHGNG